MELALTQTLLLPLAGAQNKMLPQDPTHPDPRIEPRCNGSKPQINAHHLAVSPLPVDLRLRLVASHLNQS